MAAYRHKYLDKDTIAYFPHTVDVHSLVSIQWIEFLTHRNPHPVLHARNTPDRKEVKLHGRKVDGYCAATNTVYEFNGCFWHGCPKCYKGSNSRLEKQLAKENFLRSKGYNVVSIWECEFKPMQRSEEYKVFLAKHPQLNDKLPLDVRDAFYGGRTNACCLYYKFDALEKGNYDDFTSLYPDVNANGVYPVGHPEIILKPSLEKLQKGEYFGVAKATLLPPRGLFHPVLPMRINAKLMFPLCHPCAELNLAHCHHSDAERTLTGTWCTPEIDVALEHGYKAIRVFEVHHFNKRTTKGNGIMKEYIKAFLRGKQEASGWPEKT